MVHGKCGLGGRSEVEGVQKWISMGSMYLAWYVQYSTVQALVEGVEGGWSGLGWERKIMGHRENERPEVHRASLGGKDRKTAAWAGKAGQ